MPVQNPYYSVVNGLNPKLYFRFNETAGTPVNTGSLSCTLTAVGTPLLNNDTVVDGRSVFLNNSSNYYNLSNFPAFSLFDDRSYTIELWYKQSAKVTTNTKPVLFQAVNGSSSYVKIRIGGASTALNERGQILVDYRPAVGGTIYTIRTSGLPVGWTDGINDTNWHHIAVTFNTTNVKIYIDGVNYASTTISTPASIDFDDSTTIKQIGGEYFVGLVDEFAAYDRELTSTEIADNYYAGANVSFLDTVGTASALAVQPTLYLDKIAYADPMTASALLPLPNATVTKPLLETVLSNLTLQQWYKFNAQSVSAGLINYGTTSSSAWAVQPETLAKDGLGPNNQNCIYVDRTNIAALRTVDSVAPDATINDEDFTIGLWFRAPSGSANKYLFFANDPNGDQIRIELDSNKYIKYSIITNQGTYTVTGSTALDDNAWHFATLKYQTSNGGLMYGYIDGSLISSTAVSGNMSDAHQFNFDGTGTYLSNFFVATFAAITATDISNIYNAGSQFIQAAAILPAPLLRFNNQWDDHLEALGPVNWIKFNEASGNIIDYGTRGVTWTKTGTNCSYEKLAKNRYAIEFTNPDTYFTATSNYNSGGMSDNYATITAIVKMSTAPVTLCWLAISGYGSNTDAGMALGIRFDGKPIFRILGSSFTTVVGASAITDGNWHLVTGVMDNGTIRIYIDGKQSNTNTTALTLSDSSHPIIIGGSETVINSITDARTYQLDEVAFFEQALSAQQVFELWQKIQIDIATAATSEFVMPQFNVGTGNTQTVAPATANADIVNPAVTTEITITSGHLEAFGEFLHPNYGANINIDAEYGHTAFTADALFHDPQFNIGDFHTADHMNASALMVNPTIFAGGNVSVNTLVGGDAVFVDPGIVTIKGGIVNATPMTANAFAPIPPAYFTLQDDKWYLRLFAQHTVPNIEDAFITASTTTAATQTAKTFLKFFNTETVSIAPGSAEKLENNLTVNDVADLSASPAANLTPAPLMSPGFFDAQGRKAVLFENIEFEIDEEIYNSRKPYSLEFSIKTTKANQIVAKGKWRSYTGNQRYETGMGLYNGKLYIMETNTTTGTIGDRTPHPSNPDVGGASTAILGNKNIADGQWHHIIIQQGYADNRIQMWVDGVLDRQFIGATYSRLYILGNNSGNTAYQSEFYTSAWSYDKQEFLLQHDVTLNYIGYLQYEPVKAAPMLATANIGTAKAQGNRGRALLLYFWPVTGLGDVNNTDRNQNGYFDETTFDKEVLTVDYVEQPPQQWYGWDLYPVDINGRYVSDLVKIEAYGGAENIRLNRTNPGAIQPLTVKENRRGYFRDPVTDARRYIDLVNDIDLSNFDAIFFRNYPDQSRELDNYARDEFSDSYFNLRERELYEDFVKSVRAAVDQGLSLFVSNTQLALDLGIVDRVEEVSDLYDVENETDPYTPTQLPAAAANLTENGVFLDTWRNNKFRVVNTIPELTGDASYIFTDAAYFENDDALNYGGANRPFNAYEYRANGLQVGDEFIYANYHPKYAINYQATPIANIKAGRAITAFANTIRKGVTEIPNPYKDYATSIAVEPGDILNGTPVRGKIFVNFTERISGETFSFIQRRINSSKETGIVDLITDYWINIAFNNGIITETKKNELIASPNNLDRKLANNQITQAEYNVLTRWDSNGLYILTQKQLLDEEATTIADKNKTLKTKFNSSGVPTTTSTYYAGQFFSFTYSRQYDTMTIDVMSLLSRGIRWLSTRTEDVGLVIRTEAMKASVTAVHPDSVVADHDNSVNAPALVASATIIEGVGYTLSDRNIAPVPMSAYGTFGEFVRSVSANVMTATANFREVRSQAVEVDEIVVYISYVEPILYLREDIIK